MSTEVKVWLVIGLVVIVFAVWWWVRNPSDQKPDLSMNATAMKPSESVPSPTGEDRAQPAADTQVERQPAPARDELDSLDRMDGDAKPSEPWQPPADVLHIPPPERRPVESQPAVDDADGLGPGLGAAEPAPAVRDGATPSGDATSGDVELTLRDGSGSSPPSVNPTGSGVRPAETGAEQPPLPERAQPAGGSLPPAAGESTARRYRIQDGDTLMKVAREVYKDERKWTLIKDANPGVDEHRLIVGRELIIPPLKESTEASKPVANAGSRTGARPESASQPIRADRAVYVVAEGDTLTSIAREVLGDPDRWPDIYELNRDKLKSPNAIYAGMQLKMPAK